MALAGSHAKPGKGVSPVCRQQVFDWIVTPQQPVNISFTSRHTTRLHQHAVLQAKDPAALPHQHGAMPGKGVSIARVRRRGHYVVTHWDQDAYTPHQTVHLAQPLHRRLRKGPDGACSHMHGSSSHHSRCKQCTLQCHLARAPPKGQWSQCKSSKQPDTAHMHTRQGASIPGWHQGISSAWLHGYGMGCQGTWLSVAMQMTLTGTSMV